ncbi:NAD(P)/FAD-dependent oxidoreductase [Paenibacillus filicis]|uniref:NAD(P)/FAD-dependent oxidoreductase n=1 Tax=Paenibacillus filicis TaxID=669464 RepID=A0ABU9DRB5_9BACL
MQTTEVAVIGAGIGGLSAATLLASKGLSVTVYEASGELGGCAGKFDRGGYSFAVGATYGMGFEAGGMFDRLYREVGIESPALRMQEVIMDVHLPDRRVRYYREQEAWFREIARVFPRHAQGIVDWYAECFGMSGLLSAMAEHRPVVPPRSREDIARLLRMLDWKLVGAAPLLFHSLGDRLKRHGIPADSEFVHFLNGQLIDSVQTTADRCPALLGYTALNVFHRGAFYIEGGLARISEDLAGAFRQAGGEIRLRRKIIRLRKTSAGWELTDRRGEKLLAKQVILNNSHRHLDKLLAGEPPAGGLLEGRSGVQAEDEGSALALRIAQDESMAGVDGASMGSAGSEGRTEAEWGAFVLYMGCRAEALQHDEEPPVLFHQIISRYGEPLTEGNQLLVSFSPPGDLSRAPEGRLAVTASTHCALEPWWQREGYEQRKSEYTERMLAAAGRALPGLRESVELLLPGTPVTYRRYTERERGAVGGSVPRSALDLLRKRSGDTELPGVWICGDTVYPGAGTLGTAMSGWIAADRAVRYRGV